MLPCENEAMNLIDYNNTMNLDEKVAVSARLKGVEKEDYVHDALLRQVLLDELSRLVGDAAEEPAIEIEDIPQYFGQERKRLEKEYGGN